MPATLASPEPRSAALGDHPAEGVLSGILSGVRVDRAERVQVRGIDPEKQNPDRHRPIGVL